MSLKKITVVVGHVRGRGRWASRSKCRLVTGLVSMKASSRLMLLNRAKYELIMLVCFSLLPSLVLDLIDNMFK